MVTKKRWNSFVCPGCRFVFRVPRDRDGGGTICPSCQTTLRLPREGEDEPVLIRKIPAAVSKDQASPTPVEESEPEERSSVVLLAGMTVVGVALLVGFAIWMKPSAPHSDPQIAQTEELPVPKAVSPPPAADLASANAASAQSGTGSNQILKLVEPVVKGFLSAKTIDEALPFVDNPELVHSRWKPWLDGEPYEAPGFNGVNPKSLKISEKLASVSVSLGDFSKRPIALRINGDQVKVDWESWVGWSEMTWKDFRKQKPTEPKLLRVILSRVSYYNFAFSSDSEWSSYRLESPDGSEAIYGYVSAGIPLNATLRPVEEKQRDLRILRLRFPDHATNDNQVIIEGTEGEGWVEP